MRRLSSWTNRMSIFSRLSEVRFSYLTGMILQYLHRSVMPHVKKWYDHFEKFLSLFSVVLFARSRVPEVS